ncbi:MAG: SufE family protein [Bacteroides sp.]|nr:SufE family protein [Bacteroides sp.]
MELLNLLESWQERFQYILELGESLPEMPEHLKNKNTLIQSCISKTYFYVSAPEGKIEIQRWSNAAIPSGLIAVFKLLFDGFSLEDVQETD